MRTVVLILVGMMMLMRGIAANAQEAAGALPATAQQKLRMTPVPRQPVALWTIPGSQTMSAITLSPDGKHAYVSSTVMAINVWAVLVHYWPEIASALVLLALVIVIWRTTWKNMVVGEPHCRRCNYQLSKIDSKKCPECGLVLTLRNRIIGTPRRWILVILLGVLMLVLLEYVRAADYGFRHGSVSRWFHWPSTRLFEWANANGVRWLLVDNCWWNRIAKVDMRDGSVVRVVSDGRMQVDYMRLLYSPQARCIIGVRGDDRRIELIDEDTGQRRVTGNYRYFCGINSMALDHTGLTLYAMNDRLWKCNVTSGEVEEFRWPPEWPANARVTLESPDKGSLWVRSVRLDSSKLNRVQELLRWDLREERFVDRIVLQMPWVEALPLNDGRRLLRWGGWTESSLIVDRADGIERRMDGNLGGHWGQIECTPDGRLCMAFEAQSRRIGVFNLDNAMHVGTLQYPMRHVLDLHFSADERQVFAIIIDAADGLAKVAVFDIGDLTDVPKVGPAAEE